MWKFPISCINLKCSRRISSRRICGRAIAKQPPRPELSPCGWIRRGLSGGAVLPVSRVGPIPAFVAGSIIPHHLAISPRHHRPRSYVVENSSPHIAIFLLKKKKIMLNKPIFLGWTILEYSKLLVYSFHYNYNQFNSNLLHSNDGRSPYRYMIILYKIKCECTYVNRMM